jgi:hypothetical protein
MSRWPQGEGQIEQLIANKQLQQVIGGQANGEHLLQKASRTLETAGGAMRRRRNELEYPTGPGETTTHTEARRAIQDAEALFLAARQLMPTLAIF